MAYPLYREVVYDSTGVQPSLNMDPVMAPFNATVAITVESTATFKMQFSLSPMDVADADALWFDSTNVPAGSNASILTNIAFPVSRIRFDIGALGDTLTVQVQQGFSVN